MSKYKWIYEEPSAEDCRLADCLGAEMSLPVPLARLLVKRGVRTAAEARRFFHPQLSELHNPFLMKDMGKAVERLNEAIGMKEKILVFGDYDVDGCTAVTLVYKFLHQFYTNVDYAIPDRYEDGYGIGFDAIDRAANMGVGLIIILDCGIKAVCEIAYAKEKGIDFIVCDHHKPDPELPVACAILDPKRADETYPYGDLCGCGIGFKLMQAFAQSNGLEFSRLLPLLELCAISIAADIVPIMGENRVLAYHGLRRLNVSPSVGLKAILRVCGLEGKEIGMNDIIFRIAPRINASGRIREGRETIELLIEKDPAEALRKANAINALNDARKEIDKHVTEEANAIAQNIRNLETHRSVVVYSEQWHKGVIGIVASRLMEMYYRPTVVLAIQGDYATGSARSVAGFDVYGAVESCRDLLENFGGHTYAVGLTLRKERIREFRDRFELYVEQNIEPRQTVASLDIDVDLDFADITPRFYKELKRFAPFGPLNPKPCFRTRGVYDYGTSKVVGREQEHLRLELVSSGSSNILNGIAFGQSEHARFIKTKHPFDICYHIEENLYKRGELQLQIVDIEGDRNEE